MTKKIQNIKKGQVIVIMVCLFVILGSAAGSIVFITTPLGPFTAVSEAFTSPGKSIYTFFSICILPYLILLSSLFNFGAAISSVLLLFQSFLSSCAVCSVIVSSGATMIILKTAFLHGLLILSSIISYVFSVNRVVRKFTSENSTKHRLKREKIKTKAENIIIFTAVSSILVLYCILKQKFNL